jgi:uncharacterized protein (DUF1800 family)
MNDLTKSEARDGASPKLARHARAVMMSAAVGVLVSACGGGSGSGTAPATKLAGAPGRSTAQAVTAGTATHADAFRLLTQASFGPTDADVAHVMSIGAAAWIDEQFALPVRAHHLARWNSDNAITGQGMPNTVVSSFYEEAMENDDQLRQRVAFALSEIFVVSMQDIGLGSTKSQMVASYLDMLNKDAFGYYRTLLADVAMHPAMGVFLSSMSNRKEDPRVGRIPDQNFAREVMQLFSIGLVQLNIDATPKLDSNGQPIYTYGAADIDGLSRVFTGFAWAGPDTSQDRFNNNPSVQVPLRYWTPMQGYPQDHSLSAKTFLGTTVAAQTTANPSLSLNTALDTIAGHPNVGPFISKQLIQRLVTSNPSPGYVTRVAKVFNDNGSGVRGDMKAVVKAILLDNEARDPAAAIGAGYGKLREPVLRLTAFLRAYHASSDSGLYLISSTDDPGAQLGQSPLRAPTVFNFWRPEYVSAGGNTAAHGLVAPEMQITTESSVAGYPNFMMMAVMRGLGNRGLTGNALRADVQPDFGPAMPLAATSSVLVDDVTARLIGDNVDTALKTQIQAAVDSILIPKLNKAGSNQGAIDAATKNRVNTAVLLTLASPEFIAQK